MSDTGNGESKSESAAVKIQDTPLTVREHLDPDKHWIGETLAPPSQGEIEATVGATAGPGESPFVARADHKHKLGTGVVQTANIADLAVTSAKINTGAVQTGKIADGAVTEAKVSFLVVNGGSDAVTTNVNGVVSINHGLGRVPISFIGMPHNNNVYLCCSGSTAPNSVGFNLLIYRRDTGAAAPASVTITIRWFAV